MFRPSSTRVATIPIGLSSVREYVDVCASESHPDRISTNWLTPHTQRVRAPIAVSAMTASLFWMGIFHTYFITFYFNFWTKKGPVKMGREALFVGSAPMNYIERMVFDKPQIFIREKNPISLWKIWTLLPQVCATSVPRRLGFCGGFSSGRRSAASSDSLAYCVSIFLFSCRSGRWIKFSKISKFSHFP